MTDKYNGWTNRETWALKLHLDNDQGLYIETRTIVSANAPDLGNVAMALRELAEGYLTVDGWIEQAGGDRLPASLSRIAEDIGSLYRVDWDEIAQAYLTDFELVDETDSEVG